MEQNLIFETIMLRSIRLIKRIKEQIVALRVKLANFFGVLFVVLFKEKLPVNTMRNLGCMNTRFTIH
jgi:hypothetical protein